MFENKQILNQGANIVNMETLSFYKILHSVNNRGENACIFSANRPLHRIIDCFDPNKEYFLRLPQLGKLRKRKTTSRNLSFFGGSWWIRTTEALSSRFTVCPHWPLGKAPIFSLWPPCLPATYVIIAEGFSKCKPFFDFFCDFLKKAHFHHNIE